MRVVLEVKQPKIRYLDLHEVYVMETREHRREIMKSLEVNEQKKVVVHTRKRVELTWLGYNDQLSVKVLWNEAKGNGSRAMILSIIASADGVCEVDFWTQKASQDNEFLLLYFEQRKI